MEPLKPDTSKIENTKPPSPPPGMIKYCALCRAVSVRMGENICPSCRDRANIAKLDAITEKAALEVFGQMTRFVLRSEQNPDLTPITKDDAARFSWDMAMAFRREMEMRQNLAKKSHAANFVVNQP